MLTDANSVRQTAVDKDVSVYLPSCHIASESNSIYSIWNWQPLAVHGIANSLGPQKSMALPIFIHLMHVAVI